MNDSTELPPFPSHIKITTYNDWPYSRHKEVNGTIVGEGFAFTLLNLLIRKFNFTYEIIPPKVDQIGNEKFGMISQLYKKEVDMAVAFLPIMSEFRNFCDYSVALEEMDTTFLMRRPGTSSTGAGLFAPFSRTVWYMILISLLIVGPVIYSLIHLRSKFAEDKRASKFTFFTCMWFVYGALLKQGTTVSPIGDSTRLIFATWWIFITVLTSFYTANLTAFLTLSKFTLGLDTLEDLTGYRYYWTIGQGRTIETLLQHNYPETKLLRNTLDRGYGYITRDMDFADPYDYILRQARIENRAFITTRALAQMAILDDYRRKTKEGIHVERRCTYIINDYSVLPIRRGFGFPKGSSLLKHLNEQLIAAVECGLIKHFITEDMPEAQVCPVNLKSLERRLKVSDLMLTYKVIFSGMGVAFIIFVLEVFSRMIQRCAKSSWIRNCCKSEMRGSSPPSDDPWGYPKKQDSNIWIRTPPPIYQMNDEVPYKTYTINGRDYYIIKEETGDQRLIPIRTPSAFLFQYIH